MDSTHKRLSTSLLATEWKRAADLMLSPWVLSPIVLTALFTYMAVRSESRSVITAFSVVANVSAGIVGAIIWDKWLKSAGRSILAVRGESTIRSLKLLLNTLSAVDARIRCYAAAIRRGPIAAEVQEVWLDETVEKLNMVSEQTINAMESWTDILGNDASVHLTVGRATELHQTLQDLQHTQAAAERVLAVSKEASAEERARLTEALAATRAEMAKVQAAAHEERLRVAGGPLSGLTVRERLTSPVSTTPGDREARNLRLINGEVVFDQMCQRCRKRFFPKISGGAWAFRQLCEECEEKGGG